MWTYETTPTAPKGLHYQIFNQGRALNIAEVLYKWVNDPNFRQFYNRMLSEAPFEAFYWEHPPLLKNHQEAIYEFILLPAESLKGVKAEPQQFKEYYHPEQTIVNFKNLGGDAHLVVPCPIKDKVYPHLAAFVRQAPETQIHSFWMMVAKTYLATLGEEPKWLSTAGLGVYWLHVRIDSQPKYYKTLQYKHS